MRAALIASSLLLLFISTSGLECLYYRIRSDETLTEDNVMKRNCSSKATSCLKIISRNELSQLGTATPTDATSTIEGRCAFTEHECAEQAGQCVSEPPVTRFGITIHERRCCSSEDLSNDATTAKFSIKFLCFILFIVLSPFSL
ncbi:unnamed protein product [Heligmosomoides polygyrus]|uniref:UPAR/Ly6 domain-containing protein n=1 Tax=Heligmosomoides polygyrus TaxID=6339 RepID=A0A183GCA9_HELPZ|nr:unnamed protein product [Heligmosomoides polygyrus]